MYARVGMLLLGGIEFKMGAENTASEKPNLKVLSDRERCLAQAREYITKDRTSAYGSAEDNFGNIANILNSLGFSRGDTQRITSDDVAIMMIAVKLARLMNSPGHEDSWVDMAGYAACGMDVANKRLDTAIHGLNRAIKLPKEYSETFAEAHDNPKGHKLVNCSKCAGRGSTYHLPHEWGWPEEEQYPTHTYWCNGI